MMPGHILFFVLKIKKKRRFKKKILVARTDWTEKQEMPFLTCWLLVSQFKVFEFLIFVFWHKNDNLCWL